MQLAAFAKTMIDFVYADRSLELAKIELLKNTEFNLVDCFKVFDWQSQGKISYQDVISVLREYYGFEE